MDPVSLGCGSFGCAYTVEGHPGIVVKITGDSSEAAAANAVIAARARGAVFPGLVRYLCAYAVQDRKVYVLIMEKLLPLPRVDQEWIHDHGDDIVKAARREHTTAAAWAAQIAGGSARVTNVALLIETLRALWRQAGVHWIDLHGGNVLVHPADGRWRIIDLGISNVNPAQRLPRLDAFAEIAAARLGGAP